jgi:uncharacterized coiled-coil protein SlyX
MTQDEIIASNLSEVEKANERIKMLEDKLASIKQAIAELESQEPVAWMSTYKNDSASDKFRFMQSDMYPTPVFTHPPQRTEQEPVAGFYLPIRKDMREDVKQIVEVLQEIYSAAKVKTDMALYKKDYEEAINAGNQIIAELESQEPVPDDIASILACRDMLDAQPVQRTWVGLTDEDISSVIMKLQEMYHRPPIEIFARAIEAKLNEKNT